jgi:hypothetical protein
MFPRSETEYRERDDSNGRDNGTEESNYRRNEQKSVKFQDPNLPISMPSNYRNNSTDPILKPKSNYARELQEQMRANQEKKLAELQKDRELDHYTLKSRYENDPFGRGGAGAPKKDEYGNINARRRRPELSPDPRDFLTGQEGVNIKPHNPFVNSYEPLSNFSLKARLARNNMFPQYGGNGFASPQISHKTPRADYNSNKNYQSLDLQNLEPMNPTLPFQTPQYNPSNHFSFPTQNTPQSGGSFNFPQIYPMPVPVIYMQHPTQVSGHGQDPYFPQPGGDQMSYGTRKPDNVMITRGDDRIESFKGNADKFVDAPYPQTDKFDDSLGKQKTMHKHLENQRDLLIQIEEKKRQKAEEVARKKEEEAREDERVRRENAEMLKTDETEWRRNLSESLNAENKKLAKQKQMQNQQQDTTMSVSFELNEKKKRNNGKRVRTPIEEVEARVKREQLDRERVTVEERIIKELPIEVERTIQSTVEHEITDMKKEIIYQQQNFHEQLLDLKKQVVSSNHERFEAQKEIDDLKYNLKQQQHQEEIRRTELYNAMMKTYTQPPAILPTVTRIEIDKELLSNHNNNFEFPTKPAHLRRANYFKEEQERDILDHLLSNTKMVDLRMKPDRLIETIDARPDSGGFDASNSGLKYLGYFNTPDVHQGIKIDDSSKRFDIPDDIEGMRSYGYSSTEDGSGIASILRKNNQRLDLLDEIQYKEFKKYDHDTYTSPPSDYYDNKRYNDEEKHVQYDAVDDLLEKINNPRKYLYD